MTVLLVHFLVPACICSMLFPFNYIALDQHQNLNCRSRSLLCHEAAQLSVMTPGVHAWHKLPFSCLLDEIFITVMYVFRPSELLNVRCSDFADRGEPTLDYR